MSVNALRDIIKYQDFSLLCHNLADNGRYQMESTFRNLLPGRRREAQSAKKSIISKQEMRKERFFFLLSPIQSEDETRKLLFVHSRCHCTLCRAYLFIFAKSFLGLHPLWKIVLKCGKCIARNSAWSDLQFGNELLHFLLTVKFVKPFSQGMTRISKKNECDIWRHFPLG